MQINVSLTVEVTCPGVAAQLQALNATLALVAQGLSPNDPRIAQMARHLGDQATKLRAAVDAAKP